MKVDEHELEEINKILTDIKDYKRDGERRLGRKISFMILFVGIILLGATGLYDYYDNQPKEKVYTIPIKARMVTRVKIPQEYEFLRLQIANTSLLPTNFKSRMIDGNTLIVERKSGTNLSVDVVVQKRRRK